MKKQIFFKTQQTSIQKSKKVKKNSKIKNGLKMNLKLLILTYSINSTYNRCRFTYIIYFLVIKYRNLRINRDPITCTLNYNLLVLKLFVYINIY